MACLDGSEVGRLLRDDDERSDKRGCSIRERLSGFGNIDIATSQGRITGSESHPAEIYEALALNIRSYEDQVDRAEEIHAGSRAADDAYYVVETVADVREKMALLLGERPDHIKVFLHKRDRYADGFGGWRLGGSIDPALLPLITELSEEAVTNSNIHDFRASLDAGADIITHLPCYQDSSPCVAVSNAYPDWPAS